MGFIEILLIAVGLSIDAFAVSICKGLATNILTPKKAITVGLWFGIFQFLMPVIGYYCCTQFKDYIVFIDHWVIFGLLLVIGINMIKEALSQEEETIDDSLRFRTMLMFSLATSIDALAVGITFALSDVDILPAVSLIGCTTFTLSVIGTIIGHRFGMKYKKPSEIIGGVILIGLGLKILLEHLL